MSGELCGCPFFNRNNGPGQRQGGCGCFDTPNCLMPASAAARKAAMVLTNLYDSDGRILATVYVVVPMPQAVAWAGQTYLWSRLRRRYERYETPTPYREPPAGVAAQSAGDAEPEAF